jgi:hypothetical protein
LAVFGGASAIFLVLDVAAQEKREEGARFRNEEQVQSTKACVVEFDRAG